MKQYFENPLFWIIVYIVFAVIFAQEFKKSNRKMKNPNALTILLEMLTALFAILFIPLFDFTLPSEPAIYITLLIVTIIYAFTDRLNIEARYGLDPSVFSMLKQLSTVFLLIFGFFILKEPLVTKKVIGAILILIANILLTRNKKGKFTLNKYFIMCVISNFLFAIAMLINVNISSQFNIAFYTIITVLVPSIFIKVFTRTSFKELKREFNRYDKPRFILSAFSWCIMLISSVKAYEYGSISMVAPMLTLTIIFNSIIEFFNDKDKKKLIYKLLVSLLIILGVILIKV